MPKIKTHKSTSKRFAYSGGGKLLRTRVGKSHLRRNKPASVKAKFSEMHVVTQKATIRRLIRLAPYLRKQ